MPVPLEDFPKIISVDDHVVEPAHVWQDRLPEKYKDVGPRIVIAPQGDMALVDGAWVETPGDGEKMAAGALRRPPLPNQGNDRLLGKDPKTVTMQA